MTDSSSRHAPLPISVSGVLEDLRATLARRSGRPLVDLQVRIDAAVPRRLVGDPTRLRDVLLAHVDQAIAAGTGAADTRISIVVSPAPREAGRTLLDFAVRAGPTPGATFIARLPFEAIAPEPAEVGAAQRSELILVAEDNAINQQVIVAQLKLLGRTAEVADDGHQALERWRAGRHALVLTDLQMPGMDGYELATCIRQEEGGRGRTPLVALTANAVEDESRRCKAAGMDDFLTKPVQLATLRAMLARWLGPASALVEPLADAPPLARPAPGARTSRGLRSPVDEAVLAGLVGDDPSTLRRFFRDFVQGAEVAAAALKGAVAAGQPTRAAELAHGLKASARAIGAGRLGNLCAHVEAAAEHGDAAALASTLVLFNAEVAAVCHWIDAHLSAPACLPVEIS